MGIFNLIILISGIVTSALQASGTIPAGAASLITAVETAIADFKSAITGTNGQISLSSVSILSGISAALTVLQSQTSLAPADLALVQALDKAVSAGISAYQTAGTKLDPTTLLPITPVA